MGFHFEFLMVYFFIVVGILSNTFILILKQSNDLSFVLYICA